jgi:hypothetical protein
MREDFLSLNDISKNNIGFQFYFKDIFYELVSVEKKMIPVAYGFLGDMYQQVTTITVMDKNGKMLKESNLTNKSNGGNIFNIAYIKKDWDKLDYKTVEAVERYRKSLYKEYLEDCFYMGKISELEMYKMLTK